MTARESYRQQTKSTKYDSYTRQSKEKCYLSKFTAFSSRTTTNDKIFKARNATDGALYECT